MPGLVKPRRPITERFEDSGRYGLIALGALMNMAFVVVVVTIVTIGAGCVGSFMLPGGNTCVYGPEEDLR